MNRLDTSQPWELSREQQQRLLRDINPDGWFEHEQIERCAKAVEEGQRQEALIRYCLTPEGQQRLRAEIQRQQAAARKTVYGSGAGQRLGKWLWDDLQQNDGLITRSYSREEQARQFIAQQQANLRRDNERMAALRRQVARERAGR